MKRPDKIAVPKRPASSTEMRYRLASMNKPVQLGKKKDIKKSFDNYVTQNEIGFDVPSKTKQKGKFSVRNGKPHGGTCETESRVVALKEGATPPCLTHNFFHCGCYSQKLISLMDCSDYKTCRVVETREDNFLAMKTFYPGTTLSGTGEDNYRFTKCLGEVDEKGVMDVSTSLWHIERMVEGKKLLLLAREARDDDTVWIDFERISLFAQRHAIRELVYESLRKTDDDFYEFQKKVLEEFDDLSQKKATIKEQISFGKFKNMLIGNTPVVPPRNIRLTSEGARGRSLGVQKEIKDGKNEKRSKIIYPNWEKEYSEFKELPKELLLVTTDVERLMKKDSIPKKGAERDWLKARNCMKCCLPKIDGHPQCSNFQDPEKPGICWECLLNKMDWSGNEESFESNRRGWKEWDSKFHSWKSSMPAGSDISEFAFRLSGSQPNRILFHSCRDHGKGHFHSIAIAIRLIDIETEKLHLKLDWNIKSLWENMRVRLSEINVGDTMKLQTYISTPGKIADIRNEGTKKYENEEASYFLLNMCNSLVFSMTHFVYDVAGTVFSVPLYCESFTSSPIIQGVKRPSSFIGKSFLQTLPKVWKKPVFDGKTGSYTSTELHIGDAKYALCDIACDFLHRNFFVAANNPMFTVFMPEHFDICMKGAPCANVSKGDLISFDGKLIWWIHRDDEFGIFDGEINEDGKYKGGCMKIAKICDMNYAPPDLPKNIYHVPDKIYFVNGDETRNWCEKPYYHDENGVLMFAESGESKRARVNVKTLKVPELIPFEIKLLFLTMDHRSNFDVFDESLKNAYLFEENGEYLDLKSSVKKKFVKMGYDCHAAAAKGDKKVMNINVQQFYLTCAIEHVLRTKSKVVVEKGCLSFYFPSDNSNFMEISVDENDVVSARDLSGNFQPLRCYPSCRVNKKANGKSWKRAYQEGLSWKNKHGNFYKFIKYNPAFFESMQDILSGSKDTYTNSKRFFPSRKTGWDSQDIKNKISAAPPKDEIDFLSSFGFIPKARYGNYACSFTDLLRPNFTLPSFVYHGDKPVILEKAEDESMKKVDDFEMDSD